MACSDRAIKDLRGQDGPEAYRVHVPLVVFKIDASLAIKTSVSDFLHLFPLFCDLSSLEMAKKMGLPSDGSGVYKAGLAATYPIISSINCMELHLLENFRLFFNAIEGVM